jgi:hypothetical protein
VEDLASIPIAVARISEALIANRIDVRQSAQLFWGLKLAYQAIAGRKDWQPYSVGSVTKSSEGDELAPEEILCVREDGCSSCKDSRTCTNSLFYIDPHEFDDEEEEEEEDRDEEESGDKGEDDGEDEEDQEEDGDDADHTGEEDTEDAVDENAEAAIEDKGDDENAGVDRDRAEPVAEESSSEDSGVGDSGEEDSGFTVEDIKNHKDYIAASKYLDSVCRIAGIDPIS